MDTDSPGRHSSLTPAIRLCTLGGLALRGADGESIDAVLAQPKRLALLFYLAAAGDFHRRDTLFGLFWREADPSQARAALNQSLYFLRRELGPETLVSRGSDEVGVDSSRLWCDVTAFDAALAVDDHRAALDIYQGELLPGFFLSEAPGWERWLDAVRARLRDQAATAAWELADEAMADNDAASAGGWARRAADILPYDEVHLRRLLTLLARVGDRAGAVRAYEEAAHRIAADYESELSDTTRELMRRIRAGDIDELHLDTSPDTRPPPARPAVVIDDASPVPAPPVGGRAWAVVGLLLFFSVAGVSALRWIAARDGEHDSTGVPSVSIDATRAERLVVLPLRPRGVDHAELAEAVSRELIRRLSQVTGLVVVAWTSAESFRDERSGALEIGERLGIRYVLEGEITPPGIVHMRLLEAGTGALLWSDRRDLFAELAGFEGDVAVAVAHALSIDIDLKARQQLREPGTRDTMARRHYLEGRYLLGKTDVTKLRSALDRFQAAVDRDPAYALAWSGMSDAYDHLAGVGAMTSRAAYPRARSAAERALDIDPDLAEGHSALAMALSHHYWMSEDAERHWRRALELKPSDARARRTYAGHLRNLGRFEEALAHATIARDLDPLPFFSHFELLVIPYFQREYERVLELTAELVDEDRGYGNAHFVRALALVQLGRFDEALAALDAFDPDGSQRDTRLIRAYIAGRRGDAGPVRQELRGMETGSDPGSRGFERAILHISLGQHDQAMVALEEAFNAPQFRLRLLGHEPMFDPLRGDPRFRDLLERIGLGETARAAP